MSDLRCYGIKRNYACNSSSHVTWALTKGGDLFKREEGNWHPYEDLYYEEGGNTWNAKGRLTQKSIHKLSSLWATIRGAKQSTECSHVLGSFSSLVTEEVIVSEPFIEAVLQLKAGLMDFTPHPNVWDADRGCPPWRGPFSFATVLRVLPTYDLRVSEICLRNDVPTKRIGAYAPTGARRAVRATAIAGETIWRDAYTREVLCNQEFVDFLQGLGVEEWETVPIEVIEDRH